MAFDAAIKISSGYDGSGVEKAKKGLKELSASAEATQHVGDKLKELGGKLAAAFAVEKLYEFGKGLLETGEQFDLMRQRTGIAVETLASLKKAASLNGVAFDELGVGLRKFSIAISDANHGGTAASSAFEAIRVSSKNAKGSGEVLLQVADAFSKMKDGADKAKIATLLFGKAGTDFIPTLNGGRASIEKFKSGFTDDFASRAHEFNDTLTLIGDSSKKLGLSALTEFLPTLQEIASAFLDLSKGTGGGKEIFQDIAEGFRLGAIAGEFLVTSLKDGFDSVYLVLNNLGLTLGKFGSDAVQVGSFVTDSFKDIANFTPQDILKRAGEYGSILRDSEKTLADQRVKINDEYATRVEARQKKLAEFTAGLAKNSLLLGDGTRAQILARQAADTKPEKKKPGNDGNNDPLKKNGESDSESNKIERFTKSQKEANDLRQFELDKVKYTTAEYKKLVEIKKIDAESSKVGIGFTTEGAIQLEKVTEAIKAQREALLAQEEQQKASYGVGAREAFHDYLEAAKDVAAQTRTLFNRAFQGMEDAIVKFVQTGKLNFADLANSIEADLIRIAVRQAAVGAVAGLGSIFASSAGGAASVNPNAGAAVTSSGFANGGIMSELGPVPLKRYASGGIASSPQHAIFGEGSRPEAYVPLPDGRSIPVSMKGGGGGTNVTVNVSMNSDGSVDSRGGEMQGKQLGQVISIAVTQELLKQKRPGGLLA